MLWQRPHVMIERGVPHRLLRDDVRDTDVDVVVLGARRRNAILEMFVGSVSKAIMDEVSCDALVVPEPRAVGAVQAFHPDEDLRNTRRPFGTMETAMRVSDLFSVHNVILDANPPNKESLLERLAVEAESRIGCPREDILDALQAREKIGSTALGKGVALPHTELRGAETPVILFLRLRRPIDFDAGDDEPVDLRRASSTTNPARATSGACPA